MPKGKGKRKAQPPVPPSSEQQAQAEGLVLRVADNNTGYFGVNRSALGKTKPYQARVRRDGRRVCLGYFATAEEAALCFARSPEGKAAAERAAAAPPPLTSEEALQQAQAEGLMLTVSGNKAGYSCDKPGKPTEAKKAEAWAQHVQNDEVDGWSMELGVSWIVQ